MGVFSLVLAKVDAECALLPFVVFSGRTVDVTFATSTTGSFVPVADVAPEVIPVASDTVCCFNVMLTPPPCAETTGVGPALMDTRTPGTQKRDSAIWRMLDNETYHGTSSEIHKNVAYIIKAS